MVFYRKYRPQKLSELDSENVRTTLSSIVASEKISHAFLFAGPKGLGKTSVARLLAKIVNCEKRKKGEVEPCNKCDQCLSITNGSNLDVLEIDAASNRGIDEIRALREGIKLAPLSSTKKVYIIDEVHMLTTEAFNALLKTLEEPPPHAMFLLATTEFHKLPETIVSRCFVVSFNKPSEAELERSLKRIVKAEGIKIEDDAMRKITLSADGSFRDGAKILEQIVVAAGGKTITGKLVDELQKTTNIKEQTTKILEYVAKKDANLAITFLNDEIGKGLPPRLLAEKLIGRLHELFIESVGGKEREFSLEELKQLITLFNQAALDMKYAVIPQLPLELAVVEWSLRSNTGENVHTDSEVSATPVKQASSSLRSSAPRSGFTLSEFIAKVKLHNHSIAGILRGCSIQSFDEKGLVLTTSFKFHKEKLTEPKVVELLEQVSREMTGKNVRVYVTLTESKRG